MDKDDKDYRKRRVKSIKKILLLVIIILFLLPIALCIVLFAKYNKLDEELKRLREMKIERVLAAEKRGSERIMLDTLLGHARKLAKDRGVVEDDLTKASAKVKGAAVKTVRNTEKKVYLTFDDGPSKNGDKILDILKKYDIKATFFVIGKTDKKSLERYRRIVDEGHTIALHSYTHRFDIIYSSLEKFKKDYYAISDLIYKATGVRSKFYRFPGGSSNSLSKIDMNKPIKFLKEEGITYFDWNVMSGDAVKIPLSANKIYRNVVDGVARFDESIVLLHDLPGKETTVEALPKIIKKLKKEGYLFLAIDESTKPVHHKVRITEDVKKK